MRTSIDEARRSTSATDCTGSRAICSRVMTVISRVTLPNSTGRAAAVTTTVCRKLLALSAVEGLAPSGVEGS